MNFSLDNFRSFTFSLLIFPTGKSAQGYNKGATTALINFYTRANITGISSADRERGSDFPRTGRISFALPPSRWNVYSLAGSVTRGIRPSASSTISWLLAQPLQPVNPKLCENPPGTEASQPADLDSNFPVVAVRRRGYRDAAPTTLRSAKLRLTLLKLARC